MSNSTSTQTQENPMDHYSLIESLFNDFLESGGSPKVTEFKRHIDRLIKDKIKPLCSGKGMSAHGGTGWRPEQKAKFSGRGAKWVSVSIDSIIPTLDRLDEEGISTEDYRSWIQAANYAWIRYTGPRVIKGDNMAAFEVRTVGSTFDCPKSLHYILDSEIDNTITPLNSTPHAMKLEVKATKDVVEESDDSVSDETSVEEAVATQEEVIEEVEKVVNEAPTSDDPAEWEAFLQAEGLGIDDDEDNENIFESYEG